MIRCARWLLLTPVLWAQYPLSLDLGGEWRVSLDDQPAYARPGFDDRAWARVVLPWKKEPGDTTFWLRRAVELPAGVDRSRLAITLGTVREVYELYANGVLIGSTSPFFANEQAHIPQPRSFPIPPGAAGSGAVLQLALRTRYVSGIGGGGAFRIFEAGPYRLTYLENAPVDEGRRFVDELRGKHAPLLILAFLLGAMGLLLLFLWLADRSRVELFWLAWIALARSAHQAVNYFKIAIDSTPWSRPNWTVIVIAAGGIAAAELVLRLSGFRNRWLRVAAWLMWLLPLGLLSAPGIGRLDGIALVVLTAGWWRAGGWKLRIERQLTMLTVALLLAIRINSTGGYFSGTFLGAGLEWSIHTAALTLAAATLSLLLMRQLTLDRRERQRLSTEVDAAKAVQQLLVPRAVAPAGAFVIGAVYEPAQEVGGDFYWTRTEPDGSLLVAVGDVSGKGLKAAMLVSVCVGILRNEKSRSPAAILSALNEGLAGHTGGGFVTCCCARFDPAGGVTVANAGHPAPYADGGELEIEAGLPLGVVAGLTYEEARLVGERFTLVSDGVVEAANAQGELFGFERTREISGKSAGEIADAAKAWGQNDDITVVTVRRSA